MIYQESDQIQSANFLNPPLAVVFLDTLTYGPGSRKSKIDALSHQFSSGDGLVYCSLPPDLGPTYTSSCFHHTSSLSQGNTDIITINDRFFKAICFVVLPKYAQLQGPWPLPRKPASSFQPSGSSFRAPSTCPSLLLWPELQSVGSWMCAAEAGQGGTGPGCHPSFIPSW